VERIEHLPEIWQNLKIFEKKIFAKKNFQKFFKKKFQKNRWNGLMMSGALWKTLNLVDVSQVGDYQCVPRASFLFGRKTFLFRTAF